jgi:murein DD-endopeptidase MepM/ murein hydrolase activator NlpD
MENWRKYTSKILEEQNFSSVRQIQKWLWDNGFAHNPKNKTEEEWADNLVGPEYKQSVRNFQTKAKELKIYDKAIDAKVGSGTIGAMKAFTKDPSKEKSQGPEVSSADATVNPDTQDSGDEEFVGPPSELAGDVDQTFPVVGGVNFVLPLAGVPGSHGAADFGQARGSGIHAGWDQFVKEGTPVRAMANGTVQYVAWPGKSFHGVTRRLISKLHEFGKEAFGLPALPPKTIRTWDELRAWNKANLPRDLLSRAIRKTDLEGYKSPMTANGIGVMITTDPDQNGTQFKIIHSHMSTTSVKAGSKVSAGQIIGATGTTAVFDSKAHLHFEIIDLGYSKRTTKLKGSIGKNGRKVGQIDPIYVIPAVQGASKGAGAYSAADMVG